ncbi:MAG: hypothetical protein K8R60_09155 [Burkholderiales bacterium]|nr:hypothetical protein [Burkholderiales bacterium]
MTAATRTLLAIGLLLAATCATADRFARIVEEGGEPTVTAGGYLVNQKRVAVQKELTQRPPTPGELGLTLPPGAKLQIEGTARQIAQYHPAWRVYEYRIEMSRAAFVEHFQKQGMSFDRSANNLKFGNGSGDFIDGFSGETMKSFRIWRKPQ